MKQRKIAMAGMAMLTLVLTSCSSSPEEVFPDQGQRHILDSQSFSEYNSTPPTSGPHWAAPAPWGIYAKPLANERQIHNLEHGGIILQHNASDDSIAAQLIGFAQEQNNFPCFLIVAPYPNMPSAIAVTAWGVLDTMSAYDEERLQAFVDSYIRKGPERVSCSAGGQMIR